MRIIKNDKVKVITGRDKGKTGKVLQVFVNKERVSVEGINLKVKHLRPKKQGEKGQKIHFPAPFRASNVLLVCPKCSKTTRIGTKIMDNKKKERVCKKCKQTI